MQLGKRLSHFMGFTPLLIYTHPKDFYCLNEIRPLPEPLAKLMTKVLLAPWTAEQEVMVSISGFAPIRYFSKINEEEGIEYIATSKWGSILQHDRPVHALVRRT